MTVHMNLRSYARRFVLCLAVVLFGGAMSASAQSWTVENIFTNHQAEFIPYRVAATQDGGSVAIGIYRDGGRDLVYVLRTDDQGSLQWTKVYEIEPVEYDMSIIETQDGDLVWVTGVLESGAANTDAAIVSTDADGNVNNIYLLGRNNSADETATSVIQTNNGDIVLAGTTNAYGPGRQNLVARFDAAIGFQWAYAYDMTDDDEAFAIREIVTEEGEDDLVVAGRVKLFCSSQTAGHLLILAADGTPRRAHWYGANEGGGFRSVIQATNDEAGEYPYDLYPIGSWVKGPDSDAFIAHVDEADLSRIDAQRYDIGHGQRVDEGWAIDRSPERMNLMTTGFANIDGFPRRLFNLQFPIGNLNPNYIKIYGQDMHAGGHSIAWSRASSSDEGFWFAGPIADDPNAPKLHYHLRTNPNGVDECYEQYEWAQIAVRDNGELPIEQIEFTEPEDYDVSWFETGEQIDFCNGAYIDADQSKQGAENNEQLVSGNLHLHIFPNPASEGKDAILNINPMEAGVAEITLSDIQGRKLLQIERNVNAGLNEVRLQTGELTTGMYLLRVQVGNSVQMLRITVTQ